MENFHLKFHKIVVILQFGVEFAMHGGHWNDNSVCKKNKNGKTCLLLEILRSTLVEVKTIELVGKLFNPYPNWTLKNELWIIQHH